MRRVLLFFLFVFAAFGQQQIVEDFKGTNCTLTAGNPTTVTCPTAHNFPNPTFVGIWGATGGSWPNINGQWAVTLNLPMSAASPANGGQIFVADTSMWPQTGNFTISIDAEQITVNVANGYFLNVVARGANSTTAASHAFETGVNGPITANVSYRVTVTGAFTFTIPFNSTGYGTYSGPGVTVMRESTQYPYASAPFPQLFAGDGDGARGGVTQSNNTWKLVVPNCTGQTSNDQTTAYPCSLGYADPGNIKGEGACNQITNLVVSGGTGTVTLSSPWSDPGQCVGGSGGRSLGAGQLIWLQFMNEGSNAFNSINRPWVMSAANSGQTQITIPCMGAAGGSCTTGGGVADGTYTPAATPKNLWLPFSTDVYFYFDASLQDGGPAYPDGWIQQMVKSNASFNNLDNRLCLNFLWGKSIPYPSDGQANLVMGTYTFEQPSGMSAGHGYHGVPTATHANQWMQYCGSSTPQHFEGAASPAWLPYDTTFNGWVTSPPWTGETTHYFDAIPYFYINGSGAHSDFSGQTVYVANATLNYVGTGQPDEMVLSNTIDYDGAKYNLFFQGPQEIDNASTSYQFRWSASDMTATGFSSGICQNGTTTCGGADTVSYTPNINTPYFSYQSAAMATVNPIYWGIRPTVPVEGTSGNGTSPIWIVSDHLLYSGITTGDHVTIAGLTGNTAGNATNAAIVGVFPRTIWPLTQFTTAWESGTMAPGTLTSIVSDGSGNCTVNLTVAHGIQKGWRIRVDWQAPGPGSAAADYTVTSTPTADSFVFACPGVVANTWDNANSNGDFEGGSWQIGFHMAVTAEPAVAISGTGSGNWDGSTGGTIVSTENTKGFTQIIFAPPAPSLAATGISVSDVGQHFCRVVGNVSPNAYVQVYYGTTSGGPYPYNTYPYLTTGGVFALDMGALASGTTFYYVVQARPDIGDTNGQIQSAEGSCATTSGSPLPLAATVYKPNYPNTTNGYTTITMTTVGGVFVAASTVTHAGGVFCASDPSWTVTAGDGIPTILSEIKFGAIVEFPQAATGNVPDTGSFNSGYDLPVIAVDPCSSGIADPNHRWVIFRTHQVNAADFPPYGFRTGPTWAPKLANFQAQVPTSVLYTSGQIFETNLQSTSATPIHHFWLSNLAFSVNSAASNGPWGPYVMLGAGEGNPPDSQNPPAYIVLDRIYFSTPAPPAFSVVAVAGSVGANVLFTGNYLVGFQRSANLGQGIYIEDCSTGPLSILNNEVDAAGQGIYFESVSATACGNGPPVIMQNAVVQRNAVYEPPSWLNPVNAGYGAWDGVTRGNLRNPFESKNCQYCLITGNWIDGSFSGQNSGEAILITPVPTAAKQTGATGAHDLEISWNYVRHASVLADVWGTAIIDACCGYAPDAALNSNVLFHDNLAVDLGRHLYTIQGSAGGLLSNYFTSYGVQNHLIYNNTLDFTNGDYGSNAIYWIPAILGTSDGGISSNGFQFTGNLLYFSRGVTGNTTSGIVASTPTCNGGCATFPVVPLPTTTTFLTNLQTTMVQIASAVTSSGIWGGNTVICGTNATGAEPWPDLDQAGCTSATTGMPSADLYPPGNSMAARQAAAGLLGTAMKDMRVTPTAYNSGGAVGANIQGVLSALGIVKHIVVLPGPSSLQFTYTAPDNNACSVDTSPDGATWTRATAAGGTRTQTILVTGLSASSNYQYRLMCAYSQSRPWFSFPSEPSNMATEGSVPTAAAGTGTVAVGFSLPSGAVSVKVTLTPLVGTAASAVCASSPCSIAGVANGANQEAIQYWSGAGATGKMLASGSTWLP